MEKFSKIIVPAIIGLSAVGALYVCCTHTLSRRSRAAQIDIPSTPSLPEVRRAWLVFAGGLKQTIDWYVANESWWRPAKEATEARYRAQGQ